VLVQLDAEVVHHRLVHQHVARPLARRDGRDDRRRNSHLGRDRRMDRPLHLLVPLARRDQDRQLRQAHPDRAAVAQVLAHALRMAHQLGTAQQRHEGAVDGAARAGDDFPRGGALGVVQFMVGNGAQALAHVLFQ